MNMPQIKPEISVGHIATWAGMIVMVTGLGISIGQDRAEIAALRSAQVQTVQDSRALIRLQADMDYLKRAVDELRARN